MLEADMPRFIQFDKTDFVGKAATLAQAPRPLKIVYTEVTATARTRAAASPSRRGSLHRRDPPPAPTAIESRKAWRSPASTLISPRPEASSTCSSKAAARRNGAREAGLRSR